MSSDEVAAELEGRDSVGSMAEVCLGPADHQQTKDESVGDLNPRLRRILERAKWLLGGNPYAEIV